ncbi:unnamed protein product [Chrysoparadoxa australica]
MLCLRLCSAEVKQLPHLGEVPRVSVGEKSMDAECLEAKREIQRLGVMKLEQLLNRVARALLASSWKKLEEHTSCCNSRRMEEDRKIYRLHALCNSSNDLMAWYHSVFHREIYRTTSRFWYQSSSMPRYTKRYQLSGFGKLSLPERALIAKVQVSRGTTFIDLACQQFIVMGMLGSDSEEYQLFMHLSTTDVPLRYSTSGAMATDQAAKGLSLPIRDFRISYVQGSLFLTYCERPDGRERSGVDLAQVAGVRPLEDHPLGLSLILAMTQLNLHLEQDSKWGRATWLAMLTALVEKEHWGHANEKAEAEEGLSLTDAVQDGGDADAAPKDGLTKLVNHAMYNSHSAVAHTH